MTTSDRRVLELALIGLETERVRIEREIAEIRQRLGSSAPSEQRRMKSKHGNAGRVSPNKGKPMSSAQKKAISDTMKKLWAKRRKKPLSSIRPAA